MASILIVDDEDLVRKVVRVVLEAEGHQVAEAATPDEALAEAERSSPELVILDLVIGDSDGYEVCRQLKSDHPEAKILVLSNVPTEESEPKAKDAGADDVMMKPFSALQLLERLSMLVDG